jgi:proteic killer suppression protein
MTRKFRHKSLQRLFQHDDGSKLPPDMVERIRLILSALQAAQEVEAMNLPTFHLHPLKGELQGYFAVTVRANWRIIFRFDGGEALDIDFIDYH